MFTQKSCLFFLIVWSLTALNAMPSEWTNFQKDLGRQAAEYQNSALHQQIRLQNNSSALDPAHNPTLDSGDSRSYDVGDTRTFWRWNLSVMPPTWTQASATCRAVGEHCYIFVADNDWNSHMTQADVDSALVRLEDNTPNNPTQGAIEMDTTLFGQIPDELDNDLRLIVFYSALGSFQGTSFDGYFSPYNQVTEAEAQQMNPPGHSNLCEMIYMTCYPLNPVAPIRLSVLAHELEHLIHWGQDANEEAWIDEGCAELAMVAYGVPDPISAFPSNPDNDLTAWNQQTADYVKVMLFFTYLREHYDQNNLISDLIADPANGINSLTSQITEHYPDLSLGNILQNWSVADVIDSPIPDDGLYNYQELTLPNFSMTSVNAHPNYTNQTLNPYASDYLAYTIPDNQVALAVQSNQEVYFSLLVYNNVNECIYVTRSGPLTSVDYTPLPVEAYRIVLVITNAGSNAATYSYTTQVVGNADPANTIALPHPLSCFPNPFRLGTAGLHITYPDQTGKNSPRVTIYNQKGQKVRSLQPEWQSMDAGWNAVWDGSDSHHNPVGSGIYFIQYQTGARTLRKAISVIR